MEPIKDNCIIVYRGDDGITSIYSSEYEGDSPLKVAEFIARSRSVDNSAAVCPTKLSFQEYWKFREQITEDLLNTL